MDLYLPKKSVPITTNIVSSNPAHGKVYLIQHYVIQFVSDLRQVCGFLWALRFPPPMKLTAYNITEILLKVALNSYPNPLLSIQSFARQLNILTHWTTALGLYSDSIPKDLVRSLLIGRLKI